MPNGSRHWSYTLANWTQAELESFSRLPVGAVYHVFGKEVASSGLPHLQGAIGFASQRSMRQIKTLLGVPRIHLETSRIVSAAIQYCKKDGDFQSYGVVPEKTQGKRSELELFKADVRDGMLDLDDLMEHHSSVIARSRRFALDYVAKYLPVRQQKVYPLTPWMAELYKVLQSPADERTIHFVVDTVGKAGKSYFAGYVFANLSKCQIINPGKKADMAHILKQQTKIMIVDCPRSKQGEFIQYDFLEDVKNGRILSGKYESCMKFMTDTVHVVVMMNEDPDFSKLSADRYNVIHVESLVTNP